MKEISVIIPVYNTEPYLRTCVESVLQQRELLKEIILVDDGSTDGSPAICDEYAKTFPGLIHVIHQSNQGLSAARNRGIDVSLGAYLSFIDSDDYIDPDTYAHLLGLMQEYSADMTACAMLVEKSKEDTYCRVPPGIRLCWGTRQALVEINTYRYLYTSCCNALYSREAIGPLRFPAGKLCEDYYMIHQVIARCARVAYTSRAMYHYIQRGGSISRSKKINLASMEASSERVAFYRQFFPEIAYSAEADCAFAHMGIYSAYLRQQMDCPKDLLMTLKRISRKYLLSVLKFRQLPAIKKCQALAFCFALPVYRAVIARTEHR